MPKYGLVANGELVRMADSTTPPHGDWRLFKDSSKPKYDPETEDLVEVAPLIESDGIARRWQVLTLAERRPGASAVHIEPVKNDESHVPQEVPLWAFRAVLTIQGIAPQVEGLINALPEPQKTVANVQWVYGNYIVRSHPLIQACGSQLGMTEAQIDEVFRAAATLT